MMPGEQVDALPVALPIYQRAIQGTGAIPAAGATITVPAFHTIARGNRNVLNHADNTSEAEPLPTLAASHRLLRYGGLWWLDVSLFQDGPATIQLLERTWDGLTNSLNGLNNTFRAVWTRVVQASVPFRETWRLNNAQVRIVYVNGASTLTIFDFNLVLRSVP